MNRRLPAIAVVALYIVGVGSGEVLQLVGGGRGDDPLEGLLFVANFGLFAVLGAMLLARRPRHVMGPLFAVIALLPALGVPGEAYAAARVIAGDAVPLWARLLAWPTTWYWYVVLAILVVYVPLLFPDGRLPSPRWRWVAWVTGIALLVVCVISAVSERILLQTLGPDGEPLSVANPFGIAGVPHGEDSPLFDAVGPVFAVAVVAAVASVVVRFRRSRGVERQQLKWFLSAACLVGASAVVDVVPLRISPVLDALRNVVSLIGFFGVPVSIALAILRYRLYEIDRIISRSVTYAAVTAVVFAVYVMVATLPGALFDLRSDLLVAAATLAAAAVFVPVRRRMQDVVDRRFNRASYDAARVVERFGSRLRHELDADALTGDLRGVVAITVQPAHMSLWLRDAGRPR